MLEEQFKRCERNGYDKIAFCAGLYEGLSAFAIMKNGEYFVGNDRLLKPLLEEINQYAAK